MIYCALNAGKLRRVALTLFLRKRATGLRMKRKIKAIAANKSDAPPAPAKHANGAGRTGIFALRLSMATASTKQNATFVYRIYFAMRQ